MFICEYLLLQQWLRINIVYVIGLRASIKVLVKIKELWVTVSLLFVVLSVVKGQYTAKVEQESIIDKSLTVRLHRGIVLPFHDRMVYLINDFSNGIEVNYGRRSFSDTSWERDFNYPELGIGFFYATLGNNEVYGSGMALFPYLNQFIYQSSRFSAEYKLSLGLGYVTKIYDQDTNPYNENISTHFNAYIGLGFMLNYRVLDHLSIEVHSALTHFSNGAARKPNWGINLLSTSIGAKYYFNTNTNPVIDKIQAPKSREHELLIVASAGRCQSSSYNSSKYLNLGINISYLRHLNSKKAIGIGFDQIYSESIPYSWISFWGDDSYTSFGTSDYLVSSVFVSYNVYLGKASAYVNMGAYVFSKVEPPQPVYPRIGVRYKLIDRLVASLGIKASFFASEFLEFGLGYSFDLKNKKHE